MSEGHGSGNTKLVVELVVVLVLVGFGLWTLRNNPPVAVDNLPGSSTDGTTGGSTGGTNPSAVLSYQDALVQYKDKRIQLDSNCQANPGSSTYKNGTNIMIDNRSDKSRTVRVGSTFTIPAWGFKIVNLSSSTLPATWYVDCGTSQNVATILIQK